MTSATKSKKAKRIFYVYALYRTDGTPFYIGKGYGNRIEDHEKKALFSKEKSHKNNIIRQIVSSGHAVIKKKIRICLSNETACELEKRLIESIGRFPHGPLVNITAGGEGSLDPSPEVLKKRGKRLSKIIKAMWKNGTFTGLTGKKHSEQTKLKIRKAHLGMKTSEAAKAKLRKANLGKKQTKATIAKRTETLRKFYIDNPDKKQKQSADQKRIKQETSFGKHQSERLKKFYSDPVKRQRLSKIMKLVRAGKYSRAQSPL